jgi:hypothetical protein
MNISNERENEMRVSETGSRVDRMNRMNRIVGP